MTGTSVYEVVEVAAMLGVSPSTLRRLCRAGEPIRCGTVEVHPVRVGYRYVFGREAIDSMLATVNGVAS